MQILTRWLDVRAAIVAELEGSDPGYSVDPDQARRPRGGRAPVKPGLSRAAVRTLHAAHRTLVSQVLGAPASSRRLPGRQPVPFVARPGFLKADPCCAPTRPTEPGP